MRIYTNQNELCIKPAGWVDTLVLEKGNSSCGQAYKGMSININHKAGGVMTVDDLLELRDFINKHLSEITN